MPVRRQSLGAVRQVFYAQIPNCSLYQMHHLNHHVASFSPWLNFLDVWQLKPTTESGLTPNPLERLDWLPHRLITRRLLG